MQNECIQKKLHFSLQVMKGENYTMNGTDPELPELFLSDALDDTRLWGMAKATLITEPPTPPEKLPAGK